MFCQLRVKHQKGNISVENGGFLLFLLVLFETVKNQPQQHTRHFKNSKIQKKSILKGLLFLSEIRWLRAEWSDLIPFIVDLVKKDYSNPQN